MGTEIKALQERIQQLELLVQKQNKIITQTGKNVIELQVNQTRNEVKDFTKSVDTTDFITNDDIIQLVGELQVELNNIEERSIRRMINVHKTNDDDLIAPLPNPDGETPNLTNYDFFPKQIKDFKKIDNLNLLKLAKFYECLPASSLEQEELKTFLDDKLDDLNEAKTKGEESKMSNEVFVSEEKLKKELSLYNEDKLNDMFNEVARYLGLSMRRGTDIW